LARILCQLNDLQLELAFYWWMYIFMLTQVSYFEVEM
jgi:hypothetical protein